MNEQCGEAARRGVDQRSVEGTSHALFQASVDGLDMRIASRLTRARHAALAAAAASRGRPWLLRTPLWTPTAGVTAAALLGAALWFGMLPGTHGITSPDSQSALDDLEIVAASDEGSGVSMEMLQDDLDFYDFAAKAANSDPDSLG